MNDISVTDRWRATFPGGHVGILLLSGVDNSGQNDALGDHKRALETRLRAAYGSLPRAELLELPVLKAYRAYYRRFDQTYHVQLQLESVVHKEKPLPKVSPLVDAAFAAELDTLVLTASHDADSLSWPLRIDATQGGEVFTQMSGRERTLKANDMCMLDAQGTVCTILYGQDRRTPVTAATQRVLFVAYAPAGVAESLVRQHLEAVRENVLLFAPEAVTERLEVYAAENEG